MSYQVLLVFITAMVLCVHSTMRPNATWEDRILYVRPDNVTNSSCPGLPCETLDYYANVSHSNNTQFIIMPGLHRLSRTFSLSYLENITFIGMTDPKNDTHIPEIHYSAMVGLLFEQVKILTISNLSISHFGQSVPDSLHCSGELCRAAVAIKTVYELKMLSVNVYASHGYGVAAEGLYGNSTIEDCNFVNNSGRNEQFAGGNFLVEYKQCPGEFTHEQINLVIRRCKFLGGYTAYSGQDDKRSFQSGASGISLILLCTNIIMHLIDVDLDFNKANSSSSEGGNLFVLFGNPAYTKNTFIVQDSRITNGEAKMGGGAYIRFEQFLMTSDTRPVCDNSVTFRNTNFTSNKGEIRGGAMYILFEMAGLFSGCPKGIVNITSCYFEDNILNTSKADSGVAINIYGYLSEVDITALPSYTVNISQCHFFRNKLISKQANSLEQVTGGATVYISKKRQETVIQESSFENNTVPAISAYGSTIVFEGNVLIKNNRGVNGGGLVLCKASYIMFLPHTNITFEKNSAFLFGGGIYAEEQCLQSEPLCFYQVKANHSLRPYQKRNILDTIHVIMINNTATHAGSQIFGGTMDYCYTTFYNNTYVYDKIFNDKLWQRNMSDHSYITSNPKTCLFLSK